FRRLARRIGLRDFRFYDLRHDLGTRLAINKQNQRVIMDVLGHRDPRMSVRYTHAARCVASHGVSEGLGAGGDTRKPASMFIIPIASCVLQLSVDFGTPPPCPSWPWSPSLGAPGH